MDNLTFQTIETLNGVFDYITIDRGNGEFTSMLKSDYDAQQAAVVMNIPPVAPSAEPSDTITPTQSDEIAPSEGTTNVS